ncbi:uncharacterized protein LOC100186425 isoform X1 [Ciona intestinalis]
MDDMEVGDEQDVVVAIEEDVLDMLDYDLEISDKPDGGDASESVKHENKEEIKSEPSSSGVRSSSRCKNEDTGCKNLWVSGLSATTRASELKVAFSRYGKVVGAKVVTNAKSPGSKCFGFVAMASVAAADKCILHLNKTELHGRTITVERTMSDPSTTRKPDRKQSSTSDKTNKELNKVDKLKESTSDKKYSTIEKSRSLNDAANKEDKSSARRRSQSDIGKNRGNERQNSRAGDKRHNASEPKPTNREEPYRKRVRHQDNAGRKVVMDTNKGEMSLRVNVSASSGRKPNVVKRVSKPANHDKKQPIRKPEVLTLEQIRAQRREAPRRRVGEGRNQSLAASASGVERERAMLRREREEREFLRLEREKLERERRQLERDRLEREKLEQERIRLEQERKRELERIEREKEEMRRLQEMNRYEQTQRQRLKRSYDERGRSPANNGYHKRGLEGVGGEREGRRGDRDDRKGNYTEYERSSQSQSQSSYRNIQRGSAARISRVTKTDYHDVDRRRDNEMTHDTDARYEARRVEKYRGVGGKPNATGRGYEATSDRRIDVSRESVRDANRDTSRDHIRESVRETPRDHGRDTTRDHLRETTRDTNHAREISREAARRHVEEVGRKVVPRERLSDDQRYRRSSATNETWRDTNTRGPATDRDLREEIRGRQTTDYTETSRRKLPERASHDRRSGSRSVADHGDYQRSTSHAGSHKKQTTPEVSGKPIPTQTSRVGGTPSGWTWQDSQRNVTNSMWAGSAVPTLATAQFGLPTPQPPLPNPMLGHGINAAYISSDQHGAVERFPTYKSIRRY